MFIFVDRTPVTVAFDCDFFAFSEKTHDHFYYSSHEADMAGPYEQTTWLKY